MQSFDNVVPITREVLREYYNQYPVRPTPPPMQEMLANLQRQCKEWGISVEAGNAEGEPTEIAEKVVAIPHKMDENVWRNRQQLEEIQYLFGPDQIKPVDEALAANAGSINKEEWDKIVRSVTDMCKEAYGRVENFQKEGMKKVQTVISTFLPNDWRMSIVKAQQDRSEASREAQVAELVAQGGTIKEKYDLLWELQLQRRETLVQIGNASGMYKAILQYIGGVPQVLLDFIKTVNDNNGPMDELRQKYGPQLYFFTEYINTLHIFISLVLFHITSTDAKHAEAKKKILASLGEHMQTAETALKLYSEEAEAYLEQQRQILEGSPFFVSKGDLAGDESTTETKEETVSKKYEIRIKAVPEDVLTYSFTTVGKDIEFGVEFETKGNTTPKVLEAQRRVNSHEKEVIGEHTAQGEGCFVLKWDNSYSWLASKTLRYTAYIKPRTSAEVDPGAEAALDSALKDVKE